MLPRRWPCRASRWFRTPFGCVASVHPRSPCRHRSPFDPMPSRRVAEPVTTAARMTAVEPAAAIAYPGPWGPVQIAATSRGIVGLALLALPEPFALEIERAANVVLDRPRAKSPAAGHLDAVQRYLDRLFGGAVLPSPPAVDLRVRSNWDRLVLDGVRGIAPGRVAGYGQVARSVGRPGAARAVGGAVGRNP